VPTPIQYRDTVFTNVAGGPQTSTTALAANSNRLGFMIQNQGTNTLYVFVGLSGSTSNYHAILKACSVAADGTGGSFSNPPDVSFRGPITVAGTSPSYSVLEY